MLQDPETPDLTYRLYPAGNLQIGRGKYSGGMMAGSPNTLMAKIDIPPECGLYPNGWFLVTTHKSTLRIKADVERDQIVDDVGKKCYLIPQWLMLDCYAYHWEKLYNEKKSEELKDGL